YRAYLGSINHSMKKWGLAALCLFTLALMIVALGGRALSLWERASILGPFRSGRRSSVSRLGASGSASPRGPAYSFPGPHEITTPPFFDTPFRMLARVHRSFVGLAVSTSIFVFAFWAAVYATSMAGGHENVPSQVALMRSYLLVGGQDQPRPGVDLAGLQASEIAVPNADYSGASGSPSGSANQAGASTGTESGFAGRTAELQHLLH